MVSKNKHKVQKTFFFLTIVNYYHIIISRKQLLEKLNLERKIQGKIINKTNSMWYSPNS